MGSAEGATYGRANFADTLFISPEFPREGSTLPHGNASGVVTGGSMQEQEKRQDLATRMLSCYLAAGDDGLHKDAIMLGSMVGDELQSISLHVAADPMVRWNRRDTNRA